MPRWRMRLRRPAAGVRSIAAARATAQLAVPFEPEAWIADRKARMDEGLNRLATASREGTIPGGAIENGTLRLERLASNAPCR